MMRRRDVLAGGAALAALSACGPQGPQPANVFSGLIEDWTREFAQDDPEFASRIGLGAEIAGRGFQSRLTDRSPVAIEVRRGAAVRRLAQLRAIDRDSVESADRLTYDVLAHFFEASAAGAAQSFGEIAPTGGIRPYPLNPLDAAFAVLPDFFDSVQPVASAQDGEIYLARLRGVAAVIDGETETMRRDSGADVLAPAFVIDRTSAALDRSLSVSPEQSIYADSLRRRLAALAPANPAAAQSAQRIIDAAILEVRDRIYPAMRRAHQALRDSRARATSDAGIWAKPQGDAFYAAALRLDTTTRLGAQEIHERGLARVRQLSGEIDIALRQMGMGEGPIGARLAQITADPQYRYPDTEDRPAIARVARVMAQADRWFASMPRARLEVRRVPAFAEAVQPGAYYEAPSIDAQRPGVYYINLRNVAEMTKIDLPTQDYHEAAPGHHFQTALAQQQTQIPLLRRMLNFNAFTEGWGLYAEQLADEQGLFEGDRIGRIGYLRWQMWRAARLVVDTGLHHLRWTREQAIAYLASVTGDAPGVIVTEVERYCIWPGQACAYEIGRAEIARLRDLARNELGVAFDLRKFHDVVLLNGETPLPVLESLVRAWIARARRGGGE